MNARHRVGLFVAVILVALAAAPLVHNDAGQDPATSHSNQQRLVIPVAGVAGGDLSDSWAAPRSGGRHHEGIDIFASAATPIRAAVTGPIVKLFKSKRGGITIYQRDESGALIFYYAHLQSYAPGIAEGLPVQQGRVIGYVGQTGNATTPHLHFEIRRAEKPKQWWRGQAINPYYALKSGRLPPSN